MNRDLIASIVLAAGSSSRLGQSKQLLNNGDTSLIQHTLRCSLDAGILNNVVVLGANESQHRASIENTQAEIIVNKDWQAGIGSSIKFGLSHILQQHPQTKGIIFLVCDQPFLSSNLLAHIIEQYQLDRKQIIASAYANTYGVPVFFGRKYFPEILLLNDTAGAKALINRELNEVTFVDFPGGELDIDTPEDLANWRSKTKSS